MKKDLIWWLIILISIIHIFYHGLFILFAPYGWYFNTKNYDLVYLDSVNNGHIVETEGYIFYDDIPYEYGLEYDYSIRNLCGYIALFSDDSANPDHYYIHCPCSVPLILSTHFTPFSRIMINDTLFYSSTEQEILIPNVD